MLVDQYQDFSTKKKSNAMAASGRPKEAWDWSDHHTEANRCYASTSERGMTLDEQGFHLFISNWRKANMDMVGQGHKWPK
jgi:hypothetical protein